MSMRIFYAMLLAAGLGLCSNQLFAAEPTSSVGYMYAAEIVDDDESIIGDKNIRIINLGAIVNFEGLDYAPAISADGKTLIFVSNRQGSRLTPDEEPSHDFWVAYKEDNYDTTFMRPTSLDTGTAYGNELGLNSLRNEGVASLSADQQSLFFTGCNRPDGLGDCDIYYVELQSDGTWGKPQNLGREVNSTFWDSQPSISPDKSRLYFASSRDGGEGDIDIWYSEYDFEFEEWQPAVNAGPVINTDERDWSPFIGADNTTLFYSSNGFDNGIGGLDFYTVRRQDDGSWSKPSLVPPPINTEEDDSFISAPASGDILYFSSRREDIGGYQGSYDVFMAFVPSFFRVTNVTGFVVDECSQEKIPADVTITNTITGKTQNVSFDGSSESFFSTTIDNLGYGDPKDSNMFVDLLITATNDKYGKVEKTVRVPKPAPVKDQNDATVVYMDTVKLTLGRRPVLKAEMDFSDYHKQRGESWKGLVMQEVITWSLYPLLHYVFFDEGSSDIPSRYTVFNDKSVTSMFDDERIPGGTFEKYYNVLNIYGKRMLDHPEAKLKIVGCHDPKSDLETKEGNGKALSQRRADVVYNYLVNVWGIAADRLTIETRGYPEIESNPRDSMGIVENRRVELVCDDWNIIHPILDTDPTLYPSPDVMTFVMDNGIEDNLVVDRRIEVSRDNKEWITLTDIGTLEPTVEWDWMSEDGRFPGDNSPYSARLVVVSSNGSECISEPIAIKVKQVKSEEQAIVAGSATTERPTDGRQ